MKKFLKTNILYLFNIDLKYTQNKLITKKYVKKIISKYFIIRLLFLCIYVLISLLT